MSTDTFMTASSYLAAYRALLGLLVSEECVADYRVEGSSVTVQWHNSGFDRVLQEVKKNEKPLALLAKIACVLSCCCGSVERTVLRRRY